MNKIVSLCSWFLFLTSTIHAEEKLSPAELEKWFEQDNATATEAVNEGELRFLTQMPDKPTLHSINKLVIFPSSLDDGWVAMSQCYQNLDPVASSEVVYRYKAMRDLKIISYKNIGSAQAKGQSIQLTEVRKSAELCVSAMVRIFYSNPDGSYSLVNGPFLRKFLDGYYPYHLTLEVEYPGSNLIPDHIDPPEQPGFSVQQKDGMLVLDGTFEGILHVEIVFQAGQLTR